MFATVAATPPVAHGNSGTFVTGSFPGASCVLHRAGGGQQSNDSPTYTIPSSGSYQFTRGATWLTSTGAGYAITAVCTMPAPDNRTTTSPVITVAWP